MPEWTPQEDEKLKKLVQQHGHKENCWKVISKYFSDRDRSSCRLRYTQHLKPAITKGTFSEAEDAIVIREFHNFPNKFAKIAKSLPGRTANQVKNACHGRLRLCETSTKKLKKAGKKTGKRHAATQSTEAASRIAALAASAELAQPSSPDAAPALEEPAAPLLPPLQQSVLAMAVEELPDDFLDTPLTLDLDDLDKYPSELAAQLNAWEHNRRMEDDCLALDFWLGHSAEAESMLADDMDC